MRKNGSRVRCNWKVAVTGAVACCGLAAFSLYGAAAWPCSYMGTASWLMVDVLQVGARIADWTAVSSFVSVDCNFAEHAMQLGKAVWPLLCGAVI